MTQAKADNFGIKFNIWSIAGISFQVANIWYRYKNKWYKIHISEKFSISLAPAVNSITLK
jgi:hypothetical protein